MDLSIEAIICYALLVTITIPYCLHQMSYALPSYHTALSVYLASVTDFPSQSYMSVQNVLSTQAHTDILTFPHSLLLLQSIFSSIFAWDPLPVSHTIIQMERIPYSPEVLLYMRTVRRVNNDPNPEASPHTFSLTYSSSLHSFFHITH